MSRQTECLPNTTHFTGFRFAAGTAGAPTQAGAIGTWRSNGLPIASVVEMDILGCAAFHDRNIFNHTVIQRIPGGT